MWRVGRCGQGQKEGEPARPELLSQVCRNTRGEVHRSLSTSALHEQCREEGTEPRTAQRGPPQTLPERSLQATRQTCYGEKHPIPPKHFVLNKLKLQKPSCYFSPHNMRTVPRWSVLGRPRESIFWDTLSTTQAGLHLISIQQQFHVSQIQVLRLCLLLDGTGIRLVSGCIFVLSLKSAASILGLEKSFYT